MYRIIKPMDGGEVTNATNWIHDTIPVQVALRLSGHLDSLNVYPTHHQDLGMHLCTSRLPLVYLGTYIVAGPWSASGLERVWPGWHG